MVSAERHPIIERSDTASDVSVGFGLLVTLGSGAYAIYHRWYFAELNLHLRLRE